MTHGMEEVALALQEELGDKVPDLPDLSNAKLLIPPTPILRENNWPLLEVKKRLLRAPGRGAAGG